MKNSEVYVYLTGGLGNQLFQLAAARSLKPEIIYLITSVGKPRLNSKNKAEIFGLPLDSDVVEFELKHNGWFISKVFGYLLRCSIEPRLIEKILLRRVMRLFGQLIISLEIGRKVSLTFSDNVGFKTLESRGKNQILIGYFQSYRYLEKLPLDSLVFTREMQSNNEKKERKIKRLVIHYRIGDYKYDDAFGVLDPLYYTENLDFLLDSYEIGEIWIFSDDIEVAKKLLKLPISLNPFWVEPESHDTLSTLDLMKSGDAFIIGNSTFSWWAASLAYSTPKIVIAPSPWFAGMNEPKDLISPKWFRKSARFIQWKEFE
jgi:hypothetical protein